MKPIKKNNRKSLGKAKDGINIPIPVAKLDLPDGYFSFIKKIKKTITQQRIKTVLSANKAMILLYWEIGKAILDRQYNEGWGAKVIDRMSHDLKDEFPDMSGFSPRNLKYMKKFAKEWQDKEIMQRTVAQIPWRSNITLLDKLKDPKVRLWYAEKH